MTAGRPTGAWMMARLNFWLRIVTLLLVAFGCGHPAAPTEAQAARDMQSIIDRNAAQSGRDFGLRVEGCVHDSDPHKYTCSAVASNGDRGIARVTYNADYTTWIASPE